MLVERDHPELSLGRQCELLESSRASLYYHPAPAAPQDLL